MWENAQINYTYTSIVMMFDNDSKMHYCQLLLLLSVVIVDEEGVIIVAPVEIIVNTVTKSLFRPVNC